MLYASQPENQRPLPSSQARRIPKLMENRLILSRLFRIDRSMFVSCPPDKVYFIAVFAIC
jgi:hypothetical protein